MKDSLVVSNLNYGILHDVSFSLGKNTLNALIGKSASGKTTLLNCMAGLHNFTGNIILDGNVITKSAKNKIDISFFTPLFTELKGTAIENIIEPLNNLDLDNKTINKRVDDISEKLGIQDLLYQDVETLSYSEKKMIRAAQTLIIKSDLILLDNIFDSLDYNYKNKLIKYLKSIDNSIIIFTTNDSEDLMIADNIIILNGGKVIENDTKEHLFLEEHLFTKNELKLPFIIDLSHKLKIYELIDHLEYSSNNRVNELWK